MHYALKVKWINANGWINAPLTALAQFRAPSRLIVLGIRRDFLSLLLCKLKTRPSLWSVTTFVTSD